MKRCSPVLAVLCLAVACNTTKSFDPAGTWSGEAKIKRPPTGNKELDTEFAKLDQRPVKYELLLRPDKTYTETVAAVHKIDGTWTFEGRNIVLSPTRADGKDPAETRRVLEDNNAKLQISLPLPEGLYGPESATFSDDFKTLNLPSIGTTAPLTKQSNKQPKK